MCEPFPKVMLGDYTFKIGSGATPRGGEKVYLTSGIPLIRSQNVYNNRFEMQGLAYIDAEQARQLANVTVQANDVLLNITGDSVARVCMAPEAILPARVNQHVAIIRTDPSRLEAKFLQYYLVSPEMQALMLSHAGIGATRNALTKGMIERFSIPLPPLAEQRAIAAILGSLDDKIDLNRRMNRTLEEIARALFHSWFVDFDPVHAHARGEAMPGLDPALDALFPARFEDSPLGPIPAGWRVSQIGDIANVVKGRSYRSSELVECDTALVTLKSIERGGGYRDDGLKPYSGKYNLDQVIQPGEVVVAYTDVTQRAELIGRPAIVYSDPRYTTLVASLDLGIIRPRLEYIHPPFLMQLFSTDASVAHMLGHVNGTTVLHLARSAVPSLSFVMPAQQVLEEFNTIVDPIYSLIASNTEESRTLAALRDTLLPKLLSGELRVAAAEELVEEGTQVHG